MSKLDLENLSDKTDAELLSMLQELSVDAATYARQIAADPTNEEAALAATEAAEACDIVDAELAARKERGELTETIAGEVKDAVLAEVREFLEAAAEGAEAPDEETIESTDGDEADDGEESLSDEGDDPTDDEGEAEEVEPAEEAAPAVEPAALEVNDPVEEEGAPQPVRPIASVSTESVRKGDEYTDLTQIAEAMHETARGLRNGEGRAQIATLDTGAGLQWLGDDPQENSDILAQLSEQAGTPEGIEALVASGGWGAPSEIRYGFFPMEGRIESWSTPTLGIRRGGVRYVSGGGPQLSDLIGSNALWEWTELQDQLAVTGTGQSGTKTSLQPDPQDETFAETRLQAYGVTLNHGNLVDRAWPEYTRRYAGLLPLAHNHAVNNDFIALALAAATARDFGSAAALPALSAVLEGIEVTVQATRDEYLMEQGRMFDAVMPRWLKGALRADWSKRNGVDDTNVADAAIVAHFTSRGIRPQFVHGHDMMSIGDLGFGNASGAFGAAAGPDVDILVYPTGHFVKGTGGRLDLGVVRDSTLNPTNDYTAAWSEEFLCLIGFGPANAVQRVQMQDLTLDGQTGPQS